MNRVSFPRCRCCANESPKQLLLHHLNYFSDSVTYDQFGNSDDERLKYYAYLLDEISAHENNFCVLCIQCHEIIEKLLKMTLEEAIDWIEQQKKLSINQFGDRIYYIDYVWKRTLKARNQVNWS
jgi:hypothetical protein